MLLQQRKNEKIQKKVNSFQSNLKKQDRFLGPQEEAKVFMIRYNTVLYAICFFLSKKLSRPANYFYRKHVTYLRKSRYYHRLKIEKDKTK